MNEPIEQPLNELDVCSDCDFDPATVTSANAEENVRGLADRYSASLAGEKSGDDLVADLRKRQNPTTWSALEYAAHMRDVIALWGLALHRILTVDHLELPRPDTDFQDRFAAETSYNSQDPSSVLQQLSDNASRMARKVSTITDEQWKRIAMFGESEISPLWIVRKVAHEGHHHLDDIEKSLRVARSR